MKLYSKIIILVTLCYLFVSCGSKKTTHTATAKTTAKTVETSVIKENLTTETKHFGDTLQGEMPLPVLTEIPTVLKVESGGQKLEFAITKNNIAYKSTPKHIATTTINSVKETDTKAVADVVQVQAVKDVKKQAPWRPPWWWYLIGVATIYLIYSYYKTKLTPIKNIAKRIKNIIKKTIKWLN